MVDRGRNRVSADHPTPLRDVVIGAGPAGLTAAWALGRHGRSCVVLEQDEHYVGGLSRTVEVDGNRFDIGGHRFFTKSPEIAELWSELLPDDFIAVDRLSRIYYEGKFFPYPLEVGPTMRQLGIRRAGRIVASYVAARVRPRVECSFEDWVINRFGRHLYETFFRSYTEKVWGMPCDEISKDFAAQRIRGLSLSQLARDVVRRSDSPHKPKTLIEQFQYPRRGPGQLWERVAESIASEGTPLLMGEKVVRIAHRDGLATLVETGHGRTIECNDLFVTMPLAELVDALDPPPPQSICDAAAALKFRDFLTVAVIVDEPDVFPDTWLYIHEPDVDVGRIQNYGNWSRDMVSDVSTTCLGLEYFCNRGDGLWSLSDDALAKKAVVELDQLGLVRPESVRDATVIRMVNAYPVYDATYLDHRSAIRRWLEENVANLYPAGRAGLHNYNSQDHAMTTATMAVSNAVAGTAHDPWAVNTDAEYAETGPTVNRLVARRIDR